MKNKVILAALTTTLLASQTLPLHNNVANAVATDNTNGFSGVKKVEGNQIFLNSGIVVTKENEKITTATDENGKLEFVATKKSDDLIELKNVQTGEIENVKINSEVSVEEQPVQDPVVNKSNDSQFINYSAAAKKSADGYIESSRKRSNTIIHAAEEGAVVTIITSICGPLGTMAGVAYAIANVYNAMHAKMMYWETVTSTKRLDKYRLSVKTQYKYYKDSKYTKHIKTITKYKTYQGGGI